MGKQATAFRISLFFVFAITVLLLCRCINVSAEVTLFADPVKENIQKTFAVSIPAEILLNEGGENEHIACYKLGARSYSGDDTEQTISIGPNDSVSNEIRMPARKQRFSFVEQTLILPTGVYENSFIYYLADEEK